MSKLDRRFKNDFSIDKLDFALLGNRVIELFPLLLFFGKDILKLPDIQGKFRRANLTMLDYR